MTLARRGGEVCRLRPEQFGEQGSLGRGADESVDLDDDATADEVPRLTNWNGMR